MLISRCKRSDAHVLNSKRVYTYASRMNRVPSVCVCMCCVQYSCRSRLFFGGGSYRRRWIESRLRPHRERWKLGTECWEIMFQCTEHKTNIFALSLSVVATRLADLPPNGCPCCCRGRPCGEQKIQRHKQDHLRRKVEIKDVGPKGIGLVSKVRS